MEKMGRAGCRVRDKGGLAISGEVRPTDSLVLCADTHLCLPLITDSLAWLSLLARILPASARS